MNAAVPDARSFGSAEQEFWDAFVRAVTVVPRLLDNELFETRRLRLSEYAALVQLARAENQELRISGLADACSLTISGMTRIVGRLEEAGFLQRARYEGDGRGMLARLTDSGREALDLAAPVQLAWARRNVLDHLGNVDLGALATALSAFGTDAEASSR